MTAVPEPTSRMARVSRTSIDTLNIGYQAYQTHCIECHSDRVPMPVVGRTWHPESLGLSLYTSLSDNQRYSLLEYMKAVSPSAGLSLSQSYRRPPVW